MNVKTCTRCEISKPISSFTKNSSQSSGYSCHCRDCEKIKRRKHYLKNAEKEKERTRTRKKEKKVWYRSLKETLFCVNCGENHISCLHFHHLDSTEKEYSVSSMVHLSFSEKRILAEINKCLVLCANCHSKLHWKERNELEV